ncbi:MAG: DUF6147 family protein [Hespellia sp.]|nr:DUF6147 family protein [Hespellia sp.]
MKKRVLSMLCAIVMLMGIVVVPTVETYAAEGDRCVDGSYLTQQEEANGSYTSKSRGAYMMEGDCSISKAGRHRIYVTGSTTANTVVPRIGVTMYVQEYNKTDDAWYQIDGWDTTGTDKYYISTSKSIVVTGGTYYRVAADHQCAPLDDEGDIGFSATDGIWID